VALVRLAQVDAGETAELRVAENRTSGYRWCWQLPDAVRVVVDEYVRGEDHPGFAGRRSTSSAPAGTRDAGLNE